MIIPAIIKLTNVNIIHIIPLSRDFIHLLWSTTFNFNLIKFILAIRGGNRQTFVIHAEGKLADFLV